MRTLVVLGLLASLSACVPIPYAVEPEVEISEVVVLPSDQILLTLGPRAFLESMAKAIGDEDPHLSIVDGLAFRDAAFPSGGWTLAELLSPERCEQLQQRMSVDVLVMFGPLQTHSDDFKGPYIWPAGVGRSATASTMSAVIVDLKRGELVCQVDVTAEGDITVVSWGWSLIPFPRTEAGAVEGMAQTLAERIRAATNTSRPRVALMAAEAARLWKPIGTGGWTVARGQDAEPVVYRVFDLCGLSDGRLTLQDAFDRALDLYEAEAYPAAYQCFRFVIDASGDDSTLATDARRYNEFMIGAGLLEPQRDEGSEDERRWTPRAADDG